MNFILVKLYPLTLSRLNFLKSFLPLLLITITWWETSNICTHLSSTALTTYCTVYCQPVAPVRVYVMLLLTWRSYWYSHLLTFFICMMQEFSCVLLHIILLLCSMFVSLVCVHVISPPELHLSCQFTISVLSVFHVGVLLNSRVVRECRYRLSDLYTISYCDISTM